MHSGTMATAHKATAGQVMPCATMSPHAVVEGFGQIQAGQQFAHLAD
jgi:hypothetical protein